MTSVIVTRIIGGRLFAFRLVVVVIVVVLRQFEGCSHEAVDVLWSFILREKAQQGSHSFGLVTATLDS